MTAPDPAVDPELSEIRARRRRELLDAPSRPPADAAASATPERLTGATLGRFLAAHPRVVLDVWAPWCGPCRMMSPILEGLAQRHQGVVSFGKLNADEEPALVSGWGIRGIPTFLLFENGRLVDQVVGAVPSEVFDRRIRETFSLSGSSPDGPPTAR